MAEDEIATKAPETDAQGSLVSGDTPAQEGASMGEHCVTDRPSPATGAPTGVGPNQEISKIADIDVYITKPSDYPHLPSKLLLFLSSGTGIHSKNNQLQADKFASQGFVVVMPDQFAGDSLQKNATELNTTPDSNPSMIEKVKMGLADTAKSFMIDMWLARQSQEKVIPLLHKVIEGAKDEFADAVANGDGLYAVGYCFGARYVLLLGSELPDTVAKGQAIKDEEQGVVKVAPQIKAGAIAHENDQLFPDDVRAEGQKYLVDSGMEHEIQVFPGVPHGFAVVGEYDDPKIMEAQKAAFEQMLSWLQSH
ncbi:MAG: hypothetical protein LQ337_005205 [Flavoplaca oasis]|nr:MAG: hypothetical protein LQ337_005205 [Flavoplaca oasis]